MGAVLSRHVRNYLEFDLLHSGIDLITRVMSLAALMLLHVDVIRQHHPYFG